MARRKRRPYTEELDHAQAPGMRIAVLSVLLATLTTMAAAGSGYPRWWVERGVIDVHATETNDFAAVNQGQLKWMAAKAGEELEAKLRNGAGSNITALVAGFSRSNHYAVVNQGQVKNLVRPFYERLIAEGCATVFPWTLSTADDEDFAVANIGQVKYVFAFDLDPDGDGLPDWWEQENEKTIATLPAAADADGDGAALAEEGRRKTDPLEIDSDRDGVDDLRDTAPTSAADSDSDGLPDDWERFWFGNLAQSGTDDPDGDGRLNAQEFRELTNPVQTDRSDTSDRTAMDVFRPQR